jgi:hypothetical protein
MRIIDIELAGYKRLVFNTVAVFKMSFTQVIQMVLGTNGTGKSSLLSELTPLPANGSDFNKGGSKIITISHRGNHYRLVNRFDTQKGWHSFEKNGEELNLSHLQTTQYELCQQEFGYNDNIRRLLQGKIKFSQMLPKARREWLTLLSDVDFDYAIQIYDKLRRELSAASGFLKVQRGRLVVEQQKIITTEEQTRLRNEVTALHTELSKLLAVRKPIEHNLGELKHRQETMLINLEQMSDQLLRTRYMAPLTAYGAEELHRNEWGELEAPHFTSIEQVDNYIRILRENLAAKQALLNQSVKEHSQIQETLEVLKQTGGVEMKSLSEKLNELIDSKQLTLTKRKLGLAFDDPIQASIALEACRELLNEVFSQIPENEDKRFSQAVREKYLGDRKRLQETLHTYKRTLDQLDAQKTHQEHHLANGQVECPKCFTRFAPGASERKLEELTTRIKAGNGKLQEVTEQLSDVDSKLEGIDSYGALYRQYAGMVRGYPALRAFWDYLDQEEIPRTSPRMIPALVMQLNNDLQLELEADRIQQEIEKTKQLMHQATLVGNATLAETQAKASEIEAHVEGMTAFIQQLQVRIEEHSRYRKELADAYQLGEKIVKLKDDASKLTETIIETMWMETIHHCVNQLQSQLLRKEETLNEVKEQLRRVKDLEDQITIEERREKALQIAVDTLSPKDGLIAEGLLGFIRTYVRQMNGIIKKIWSYPLVVKECGIADGNGVELDYKFPMLVADTLPVSDVSDGSSGIVDVVDLAFMVIAMKYLGLAESPLFADEFTKSFDNEHKKTAMVMIKTLMETTSLTQLFMISHDYQHYSSFANVEVCVLDPKNIVVPDTYNEHVMME